MLFTPVPPMLAAEGETLQDDEAYLYEPKWDGLRLQLHKMDRRIEAYNRAGVRVSAQYPELLQAANSIAADEAILDCESVCLRDGRPVFDDAAYRGRLSHSASIERAVRTHPLTFIAFDVLYTKEGPHLEEPLLKRKQRLQKLVLPGPLLVPTMYIEGHGTGLLELTRVQGLEGVMAKRKDSRYIPAGRSADWLKYKHMRTIDAVILGYRQEPFAFVLGLHFRTLKNKPVAVVEQGISAEDIDMFRQRASGLNTTNDGRTQWIEPVLVCRIQYGDRTDLHQLKRTVFERFIPDKRAAECVWRS